MLLEVDDSKLDAPSLVGRRGHSRTLILLGATGSHVRRQPAGMTPEFSQTPSAYGESLSSCTMAETHDEG